MPLFNLFKKPKLAPPQSLEEPDLSALDPLVEKYRTAAATFAHRQFGRTPAWARIKEAFDDVVFMNFRSIKFFIDAAVDQFGNEWKSQVEERVKRSSSYAASCGWIIGREWGSRDPTLRARLRTRDGIDTDDVPADAMELLGKAVYYLYSVFAEIFTTYYDSEYGRRVRRQKDDHLRDTYQSFMKGMLICFLSGVKSLDIDNRYRT